MMSKLPTAEEFLLDAGFPGHAKHGLAKKWMIEFAKLHVENCKEELWNKIHPEIGKYIIGTKEDFLNAYPLTNIK